MRMLTDRDAAFERQSFTVQMPDFMIRFVANAQFGAARPHRQAGKEGIGFFAGRMNGTLEVDFAGAVTEFMNLARISARNIKLFAVGAEREAVPGPF